MELKHFKIVIPDENKVWHNTVHISHLKGKIIPIKLKETIMGCGIAQMYGSSTLNYLNEEELQELKLILNDYITDLQKINDNKYACMKVGYIISTLGHNYKNREENLLKLGFKKIADYSNWKHNTTGTEIQLLYGLHTKYDNIENLGVKKRKKKVEQTNMGV